MPAGMSRTNALGLRLATLRTKTPAGSGAIPIRLGQRTYWSRGATSPASPYLPPMSWDLCWRLSNSGLSAKLPRILPLELYA